MDCGKFFGATPSKKGWAQVAMPVDYSKFDKIEDSDEEDVPSKATSTAAPAFAPPSRAGAGSGGRSAAPTYRDARSGRETLEPVDPAEQLRIVGPCSSGPGDLSELERWSAPAPPPHLQGDAQSERPKPDEPQRLCVKADGRRKIHTTYPDGSEMVEEYDERTDMLLVRKARRPTRLGGEGEWKFEVGQEPAAGFDPHSDVLRPSASNPIFLRKDTPDAFQWRIRNLSYPANVYSVTVDHEKQEIVVRTSNKKYYKRFDVPDLRRLGLTLQEDVLEWKHNINALIITYPKPAAVLKEERKVLQEAEKSAMKL